MWEVINVGKMWVSELQSFVTAGAITVTAIGFDLYIAANPDLTRIPYIDRKHSVKVKSFDRVLMASCSSRWKLYTYTHIGPHITIAPEETYAWY